MLETLAPVGEKPLEFGSIARLGFAHGGHCPRTLRGAIDQAVTLAASKVFGKWQLVARRPLVPGVDNRRSVKVSRPVAAFRTHTKRVKAAHITEVRHSDAVILSLSDSDLQRFFAADFRNVQ